MQNTLIIHITDSLKVDRHQEEVVQKEDQNRDGGEELRENYERKKLDKNNFMDRSPALGAIST